MVLQPQIPACLVIFTVLWYTVFCFQFRQIQVTATSLVPGGISTYSFLYNRTITNSLAATGWSHSPLSGTSAVIVNFPRLYLLPAHVICSYQINSTSPLLSGNCTANDNQITLTSLFENQTYLATLTLIIENIINPTGERKMVCFSGRIGQDQAKCKEQSLLTEQTNLESDYMRESMDRENKKRNLGSQSMVAGSIEVSIKQTGATGVGYNISFTLSTGIYSTQIFLKLPSSISIDSIYGGSIPCFAILSGIYLPTYCVFTFESPSYVIKFTSFYANQSEISAGSSITLVLVNCLINPATTAPAYPFTITAASFPSNQTETINMSYNSYLPRTFSQSHMSISTLGNLYYNIYTLTFNQITVLPRLSLIYVQFPSALKVLSTSSCSIKINSIFFVNITVIITGNLFKIRIQDLILPCYMQIIFTGVDNPISTKPFSGFIYSIKTADDLYLFSYEQSTQSMNIVYPSGFKTFDYIMKNSSTSNTSIYVQLIFQSRQSEILPSYLQLNSTHPFISSQVKCTDFINFIGTCTVRDYNIYIDGNFSGGEMAFKIFFENLTIYDVHGFLTTSFTSEGYAMNQNWMIFACWCGQKCKLCFSPNSSQCWQCHESLAISSYNYMLMNVCYTECPAQTYSNYTKYCNPCDSLCLTCVGASTFCTSCHSNGSYPYLNLSTFNQSCLANCDSNMTPDFSANPVICVCKSNYFILKEWCLRFCPTGYESIGNRCVISLPNKFTLAFSICGMGVIIICVLIWALGRLKLVFMAISSLLGLLQSFLLINLFILRVQSEDIFIGHAFIECLVVNSLLNIFTVISLAISCYNQIHINQFLQLNCLQKVILTFMALISLIFSHKFIGLLFSGLFGLKIFSLQIEKDQLSIYSLSKLFSLVVSFSIIFVSATTLGKQISSELKDCCLDAIVLYSVNIIFTCLSMHKAGVDKPARQNKMTDSTIQKIDKFEKFEKSGLHSQYDMEIESRA